MRRTPTPPPGYQICGANRTPVPSVDTLQRGRGAAPGTPGRRRPRRPPPRAPPGAPRSSPCCRPGPPPLLLSSGMRGWAPAGVPIAPPASYPGPQGFPLDWRAPRGLTQDPQPASASWPPRPSRGTHEVTTQPLPRLATLAQPFWADLSGGRSWAPCQGAPPIRPEAEGWGGAPPRGGGGPWGRQCARRWRSGSGGWRPRRSPSAARAPRSSASCPGPRFCPALPGSSIQKLPLPCPPCPPSSIPSKPLGQLARGFRHTRGLQRSFRALPSPGGPLAAAVSARGAVATQRCRELQGDLTRVVTQNRVLMADLSACAHGAAHHPLSTKGSFFESGWRVPGWRGSQIEIEGGGMGCALPTFPLLDPFPPPRGGPTRDRRPWRRRCGGGGRGSGSGTRSASTSAARSTPSPASTPPSGRAHRRRNGAPLVRRDAPHTGAPPPRTLRTPRVGLRDTPIPTGTPSCPPSRRDEPGGLEDTAVPPL